MSKLKKIIIILSVAVLVAVGILIACDNISQTYYKENSYTIVRVTVPKDCSKIETIVYYKCIYEYNNETQNYEDDLHIDGETPLTFYKGQTIYYKIEFSSIGIKYKSVKLTVTYTGLDGKVTTQTINVQH